MIFYGMLLKNLVSKIRKKLVKGSVIKEIKIPIIRPKMMRYPILNEFFNIIISYHQNYQGDKII